MPILLLLPAVGLAATLTVDPASSGAYPTIQDAIDAASSGDRIEVVAGSYGECIDYSGKTLEIVGLSGSANTTLNAGGSCSAAATLSQGEGAGTRLQGFTLRNRGGRGVSIQGASLELQDVIFDGTGSPSLDGGGLRAENGAVELDSVSFDATTGDRGGAIFLENSSLIAISSTFHDSYATQGGTVATSGSSSLSLESCTVDTSTSDLEGGALYLGSGGEATSSNSTWTGISAWYGHGGMGYLETGAQLHLDNDSFTSISLPFASTGYDGGLIYAEGGAALETIAITVEGANARTGGMIYLDDQGTWSDEASNLYDASALGNGGLLYAGDNTVITLTDTFVSLPVAAGANGGAFYGGTGVRFTGSGLYISGATASNGSSTGGAIYLDSSHDLSLRDCTIEDSSAWGSPAIYAYQGASLQIDGCTLRNNVATGSNYASAIFLNNPTGDMSISSSSFSGNTGAVTTSGGANPVATLSLRDCLFESNSSDRAAVSTEHNLSLSDSQFLDNSGDNGSSNTPGGALFVSGGNTAITDCRFEGNSAYEGAAIYADEPTSFVLSGTHFDANRMTNAGGGLLLYHPTSATIYNNWFCNNGSDSSSTSGGGAHITGDTSGSIEILNNIFVENETGSVTRQGNGGALYVYYAELTNNTFVGNRSTYTGLTVGGVIYDAGYTTGINNIIADSSDGYGIGQASRATTTSSWSYNAFSNNLPGDVDPNGTISTSTTGNITDPPLFLSYSADGDCSNDLLVLDPASTLIDAGSRSLVDPDGSRSDIGAYGGSGSVLSDADGDGSYSVQDCDDRDASVYPGAAEVWYDGVDQDCDGASDYDADGDGEDSVLYGGPDCDDRDAAVLSTAAEVWYDGVDQNCDGASDYDADGDGEDSDLYGGPDCDDGNSAVHTGATDSWYDGVDQNCDGANDYDADGDGAASLAYGGTDCDDANASVYPGAAELEGDGVDQNCDGRDTRSDQDGDGYDALADGGADCNDGDATIHPGATEVWYDGVDQDCDGADDYDADADGHRSEVYGGDDCNDQAAEISPSATEICDRADVDEDCDGLREEEDPSLDSSGLLSSYTDADGDGYGAEGSLQQSCDLPEGRAAQAGDCDDSRSDISPEAQEQCNSLDDNCDGSTDEGLSCGGDDSGTDDSGPDDSGPNADDTGKPGPDCGCASGTASTSLWALGLFGLLGWRRRRTE